MFWRVQMRAAVFGRSKPVRRIVITLCCEAVRPLLELEAVFRGPVDSLRIERMGQIDNLCAGEINLRRRFSFGLGTTNKQKTDRDEQASFHFGSSICVVRTYCGADYSR